ncbi:MAG: hypothetical protein KY464_10960 [Gemmatimonadetes bacterium]|nr:hypothetical protein [Gemmatimonadota bacterium]
MVDEVHVHQTPPPPPAGNGGNGGGDTEINVEAPEIDVPDVNVTPK